MNHKGQTLVAFVILLPLVLLIFALVIDTGYILKEHIRLQNTTKIILQNTFEKRFEDDYEQIVWQILKKNNISTQNLQIKRDEKSVVMENHYTVDSIFGKMIGLKNYKIQVRLKATKVEDQIKIQKE